MPNHLSFFAIHVDDCDRAIAFYEGVFGWRIEPWGPPEFFLVDTGEGGVRGAIQKRRKPATGEGIRGFECTMGVASIDDTIRLIEAHGGTITIPKVTIPTVGTMCQFNDPEGNLLAAMEYEVK